MVDLNLTHTHAQEAEMCLRRTALPVMRVAPSPEQQRRLFKCFCCFGHLMAAGGDCREAAHRLTVFLNQGDDCKGRWNGAHWAHNAKKQQTLRLTKDAGTRFSPLCEGCNFIAAHFYVLVKFFFFFLNSCIHTSWFEKVIILRTSCRLVQLTCLFETLKVPFLLLFDTATSCLLTPVLAAGTNLPWTIWPIIL